jgi:uncharacterized protein (DUF433 family)
MTSRRWVEDNWADRIWIDKDRMAGEPCIKGTRVTVALLVAAMADTSIDELIEDYPQLTREDVQAALTFAAVELRKQYVR